MQQQDFGPKEVVVGAGSHPAAAAARPAPPAITQHSTLHSTVCCATIPRPSPGLPPAHPPAQP
jgi:hypothetical protein